MKDFVNKNKDYSFSWAGDLIPAVTCYVDKTLTYRFMNAKYRKMFKLDKSCEVSDYTLPELIGEKAFSMARPHLEKVFNGEVTTYEIELKNEELNKVLQIHYYPDIKVDKHKQLSVNGVFMMALDVTELRHTQNNYKEDLLNEVALKTQHLSETIKKLENTQSQLLEQEKMASLGRLITGIAHELNTPIGSSLTAISSLKEYSESTINDLNNNKSSLATLTKYLHKNIQILGNVENNIKKTTNLIDTFKTVSTDHKNIKKSKCDLHKVTSDVLHMTQLAFPHLQIEHQLLIPEPLFVDTYKDLFIKIIKHLTTNSYIHGFTLDRAHSISIEIIKHENNLHINYKDNGVGISKEEKKLIFNPFYTTKPLSENTGLGMTIIYNLIKAHFKGDISIKDNIPSGITIDINIPL